ncbi:MAG: hypothetical protein JW936_07550 [Sedimentisphaerales bacterium]|nr:hypothetical protein [Sedimentisphaerales bacterium]
MSILLSCQEFSDRPQILTHLKIITLDLSADHLNEDEVMADLLRSILDMAITPRRITEGRSLETHFLEVTGGGDD